MLVQSMELAPAARQAARAIRAGALQDTPSASQVARESWGLLADMNEAGMLTFDSQDAPPGSEMTERAYVQAFMTAFHASTFVDALNRQTDKIAMVVHPCRRFEMLGRIPVTQGRHGAETRFPPYMSMADHRHLKKVAGLRASAKVVMVECLDARWGRCAWKKDGLFRDIVTYARAPGMLLAGKGGSGRSLSERR